MPTNYWGSLLGISSARTTSIVDAYRQSTQLNPDNHPAAWITEPSACSDCERPRFPSEDKPAGIDDVLWEEFEDDVCDHLSGLNRFARVVQVVSLVLVLLSWGAIVIDQSADFHFIPAIPLFLAMLIIVLGQICIVLRNEEIDKAITATCARYDGRFRQQGFSVRYRTRWTGISSARTARVAARVIVFIPTLASKIVIAKGEMIARTMDV